MTTVTTYIPLDEAKRMHDEQMKAYDFLKTHKIAISFKWRGAQYGYFGSHEEADAKWVSVLREEGYVAPKWWQVSRWGEKKPPKEVLATLKESSNA